MGRGEGGLALCSLHGSQHLETVSKLIFLLSSQPLTLNPANWYSSPMIPFAAPALLPTHPHCQEHPSMPSLTRLEASFYALTHLTLSALAHFSCA